MSSGVLSDKKYRAWLKSFECKSRGESGDGAATGLSDVLPDMSCSAGWRSCGAINFEEISTRAAGRASPQASPTNILLLYFFPKQCLTAVVSSFDTSLPHPCPLLNLPAWKDKRWLGEILLRPCSGVHSAGWKYEFVSGQQRCLTVHALARYYFESNQGLLLDVP